MRLAIGDGPLPRLRAAGLPDWIGADGERIGWAIRDRLFLLDGEGVTVVPLPEFAEDVVASAEMWTIALGNGFVGVDPVAGQVVSALVDDEAEPVATRPGRDVGLFVEVPEHRLLRLSDGLALPLPSAALHARRIRPWATGVGACWVDLDTLYRMGGRIAAIGKTPGAEGIACGPEGAVLVTLPADTVVAAPKQLAVRVGRRIDADSARFSPDGGQVLGATEDGAVLVSLADGKVVRTWSGSLAPVGFARSGPVFWDVDRGLLVDAEGVGILDGFAGAAPSQGGALLAGPGGALWDLDRGERVRTDLAGGVTATDGERVAHVTDTEARVLGHDADGPRFPHGLVTDEDAVATARIEADTLVITTMDGESGTFQLADGAPLGRKRAGRRAIAPASGVTVGGADGDGWIEDGGERWPLPADAAVRRGGRLWAWTDDGALFELP